MTHADHDYELEEQRLALADTIAWDAIYARATAQAHATGFAQLVLEHGLAEYEMVDGRSPDALKIARLRWAKIHVILDWTG